MKPHMHAALIKAWADGAIIEYRSCPYSEWRVSLSPAWGTAYTYRIKPEVVRYKRYLVQYGGGNFGVDCLMDWQTMIPPNSRCFVKWIDTEWQELHF